MNITFCNGLRICVRMLRVESSDFVLVIMGSNLHSQFLPILAGSGFQLDQARQIMRAHAKNALAFSKSNPARLVMEPDLSERISKKGIYLPHVFAWESTILGILQHIADFVLCWARRRDGALGCRNNKWLNPCHTNTIIGPYRGADGVVLRGSQRMDPNSAPTYPDC